MWSPAAVTPRWTLDDIAWDQFNPALVDADLLCVVKTASLVEANAADYVTYLRNVFDGDADFIAAAEHWGLEERQHGEALGRWAELADPAFSFEGALADFKRLYHVDLETQDSIRGSRAAELIARQVVESGTSSFYSAIRDAAQEPVLKAVAGKIATDEFLHYQLFRKHFRRYDAAERMGTLARLKVAASRFQEAEDDELGYAYFSANILPGNRDANYQAANYGQEYWKRATRLYQRDHIDNVVRMVLTAADLNANGWLHKVASAAFWGVVKARTAGLAKAA
jgi:rubrerythrin